MIKALLAVCKSASPGNSSRNRACYSPLKDEIHLPHPKNFHGAEGYEATKAQGLCHWTGHGSRLARPLLNALGTEDYVREELRAELGASFLMEIISNTAQPREDQAQEITETPCILDGGTVAI